MAPQNSNNNLPVWDEQAALLSTGGDGELARSLLASLIEQLPEEIAKMRRLAAEAKLAELADKAHRTRGGALYCGVPALIAALGELERQARAGDCAPAAAALAEVADQVRRLRELRL